MPSYISFLSDFGHSDEFVGVVHGVIAKIAPETRVIDIVHDIHPGSVRSGALSLMRAIHYLPEGVALAVVDPEVGTDRMAVAVQTDWGFFVGPDNGLLSPAVAFVGGARQAHQITNPELLLPTNGATFDGRDRFAPAAAVLAAREARIDELGPPIDPSHLKPMVLPLPSTDDGVASGHTWWIDRFGNVQTNLSPDDLDHVGIAVGDRAIVKIGINEQEVQIVTAYGDVAEGELMAVVDSQGLIALSERRGNAAESLAVGLERPVTFRPVD